MAEIVGIVSAAITFVDFICKITKTVRKVHDGLSDGIGEYNRLKTIAQSLKNGVEFLGNDASRRLRSSDPVPEGRAIGVLEQSLNDSVDRALEVSQACFEVVDEIIKLIDKVSDGLRPPNVTEANSPSGDGKVWEKSGGLFNRKSNSKTPVDNLIERCKRNMSTSWKGTKVALSMMWHESELDGLRKEFDTCATIVGSHWNTVFSLKIINMLDRQSEALRNRDLEARQIANEFSKLSVVLEEMRSPTAKRRATDTASLFNELQITFKAIGSTLAELNRHRILSSIRFEGMTDRQYDITEAEPETLDWILQKPLCDFSNHPDLKMTFSGWLSGGEGVFNITGKPGSGKSTLMKHLATRRLPPTKELLQLNPRATGKPVLVTGSYLWMLGQSKEQRSFAGLVRYILHELLRQAPELIKAVFPQYWADEWSLLLTTQALEIPREEFDAAFVEALNAGSAKYHLCLLIDAADELEDDKVDFHRLGRKISEWGKVSQVCVFSREEPAFMDAFPANQRIRLHLVNEDDIRTMVRSELYDHSHFRKQPEADCNALIDETVKLAEGVFLWASLVVKEMRYKLDSRQKIPALRQVLEWLPRKLEDCFERILLDRILSSSSKRESCTILQIAGGGTSSRGISHFGLWFYSRVGGFVNNEKDQLELDSTVDMLGRGEDFHERVWELFRGLMEPAPQS
ncbi:hypothetical protein QBC44DRAFT_375167 [Cladorrhinum sp. PSN332]|nr:hypothetical protein QBC44DRAFT_375167 [Cladorrhinum sp. PSN332]